MVWPGSHLMYLIGFRNRPFVLINWAWHYLRWPSGRRLIVGDTGPDLVERTLSSTGDLPPIEGRPR